MESMPLETRLLVVGYNLQPAIEQDVLFVVYSEGVSLVAVVSRGSILARCSAILSVTVAVARGCMDRVGCGKVGAPLQRSG
jgi:hypothetical protein